MAVWLYRIAVRAGNFDTVRASVSSITDDQRIQVLLIAFCFGGFIEGAAGFGIPIAICAALLVSLGFNPLKASMLALVANAASGAYGAIGIPVTTAAKVANLDTAHLSAGMVPVLHIFVAHRTPAHGRHSGRSARHPRGRSRSATDRRHLLRWTGGRTALPGFLRAGRYHPAAAGPGGTGPDYE